MFIFLWCERSLTVWRGLAPMRKPLSTADPLDAADWFSAQCFARNVSKPRDCAARGKHERRVNVVDIHTDVIGRF